MKLFFKRFGEGDPLVILHGLFGLSDNWVTIGKRLSEHFTVYIPDLRNHGRSQHSPVFTVEALVGDLVEFMEENHLEKAVLTGHSLGGLVAMHFALNYQEKVKKLIVVDISMRRKRDYSEHLRLVDAMERIDFSAVSSRRDAERILSGEIPSLKLRQFLLKNVYWRDRNHLDWRLNLKVLGESLPIEIPEHHIVGQFDGDTLFIRGRDSDYILDEEMPEILDKFPRAILKTIEGAGHWVHADAPEEFLEAVSDFIHS